MGTFSKGQVRWTLDLTRIGVVNRGFNKLSVHMCILLLLNGARSSAGGGFCRANFIRPTTKVCFKNLSGEDLSDIEQHGLNILNGSNITNGYYCNKSINTRDMAVLLDMESDFSATTRSCNCLSPSMMNDMYTPKVLYLSHTSEAKFSCCTICSMGGTLWLGGEVHPRCWVVSEIHIESHWSKKKACTKYTEGRKNEDQSPFIVDDHIKCLQNGMVIVMKCSLSQIAGSPTNIVYKPLGYEIGTFPLKFPILFDSKISCPNFNDTKLENAISTRSQYNDILIFAMIILATFIMICNCVYFMYKYDKTILACNTVKNADLLSKAFLLQRAINYNDSEDTDPETSIIIRKIYYSVGAGLKEQPSSLEPAETDSKLSITKVKNKSYPNKTLYFGKRNEVNQAGDIGPSVPKLAVNLIATSAMVCNSKFYISSKPTPLSTDATDQTDNYIEPPFPIQVEDHNATSAICGYTLKDYVSANSIPLATDTTDQIDNYIEPPIPMKIEDNNDASANIGNNSIGFMPSMPTLSANYTLDQTDDNVLPSIPVLVVNHNATSVLFFKHAKNEVEMKFIAPSGSNLSLDPLESALENVDPVASAKNGEKEATAAKFDAKKTEAKAADSDDEDFPQYTCFHAVEFEKSQLC